MLQQIVTVWNGALCTENGIYWYMSKFIVEYKYLDGAKDGKIVDVTAIGI
jgi:hypothetical protein